MTYYTDKLPRLWFLRPWHHVRQLHQALMAIASYSKTQQALIESYETHETDLIRERDRAIILANKYRYKFEARFDYIKDVYDYENKNKPDNELP
jgi:hypothetical protein